jgi:hypothetical protein
MTEAAALQVLASRMSRDGGSLRTANEARTRAAVTEARDTPEIQGAVNRLDRVLRGGHPPRTDVPRGYYVNIQV